jgi:putative FmdB family regulatory protein
MPTYEYTCKDCDTKKQIVRGINDKSDNVLCDSCKNEMKRVYSVGAITFNGSGFYRTDK